MPRHMLWFTWFLEWLRLYESLNDNSWEKIEISHGRFWNLFVVCRWKLVHCGTFENRFGRNKQWHSSILYAFYWILKVLTPPNLSMKNNSESPMGVPWEIYRVRCGDSFFTPTLGTRVQNLSGNFSDTIWISKACWVKYSARTTFQF